MFLVEFLSIHLKCCVKFLKVKQYICQIKKMSLLLLIYSPLQLIRVRFMDVVRLKYPRLISLIVFVTIYYISHSGTGWFKGRNGNREYAAKGQTNIKPTHTHTNQKQRSIICPMLYDAWPATLAAVAVKRTRAENAFQRSNCVDDVVCTHTQTHFFPLFPPKAIDETQNAVKQVVQNRNRNRKRYQHMVW